MENLPLNLFLLAGTHSFDNVYITQIIELMILN
jgi:hypothetical protein